MSTRERFSDISRELKGLLSRLLLALLGIACPAVVSGCLVTDTIEFEDARNAPVTLVEFSPETTIIATSELASFTVKVWDADDQATPEQSIAAKIIALSDEYGMSSTGTCSKDEYYVSENEGYGFEYNFICALQYNSINRLPAGAKFTVILRVSDRGFDGTVDQDALKIKPGAQYVDATWVIIKD